MAKPLSHHVHILELTGKRLGRSCNSRKTWAGIAGCGANCLPVAGVNHPTNSAPTARYATAICNDGLLHARRAVRSNCIDELIDVSAGSTVAVPMRLSNVVVISETIMPQPIPTNGAR